MTSREGKEIPVKQQTLPFAIDSVTGEAISEELEVLLAWMLVKKKLSPYSIPYSGEMAAFAKIYYPLWIAHFGERLALLDPVVRQDFKFEYREPAPIDGFIDRLQLAHFKPGAFKNVLSVHQNAFAFSDLPTIVKLKGLLRMPDATGILDYVRKSGHRPSGGTAPGPTIGDPGYGAVTGDISLLEAVMRALERDDRLQVALNVLRTETDYQLKRLNDEIEGIKTEYAHEIEATKEILRQSVEKLTKRRDEEIEIISSRFSEIKELLISDIRDLRKTHTSVIREEGYIKKIMDADVSAAQPSNSDEIRRLLGDHSSRLKTLKDEESKVKYLADLVDKEKNRQIVMVMGLYNELIKSKSRITSNLQIEQDIELEKRVAEINELSGLQASMEEKVDAHIRAKKSQLDLFEWLLPNNLEMSETSLVYIPFYLAYLPGHVGKSFIICGPGIFNSGHPPVGVAYDLEDRMKPISIYFKALLEVSLLAKIQRDKELRRQAVLLAKEHDILATLPDKAAMGLRLAKERGWVSDNRLRGVENSLNKGRTGNLVGTF